MSCLSFHTLAWWWGPICAGCCVHDSWTNFLKLIRCGLQGQDVPVPSRRLLSPLAVCSQGFSGLLEFNSNIFSLMRRFSQSGCYLCFDFYRFPQSFESVCISVCWSLVFPLDLVALLFPWLVHSPVFPFSLDCAGVVCPLGFYDFIKFGDMLNNPSQVFQASSFVFLSLICGFLLCDLWVCFRSFCRPLARFASLTDYLCATSAWIKDLDFTVCLQCVLFLVFLTHNLFSVGGCWLDTPKTYQQGGVWVQPQQILKHWGGSCPCEIWSTASSSSWISNEAPTHLWQEGHFCSILFFQSLPTDRAHGGRGNVASWQLAVLQPRCHSKPVCTLPDTRTKTQRYLNSSTWGSN